MKYVKSNDFVKKITGPTLEAVKTGYLQGRRTNRSVLGRIVLGEKMIVPPRVFVQYINRALGYDHRDPD